MFKNSSRGSAAVLGVVILGMLGFLPFSTLADGSTNLTIVSITAPIDSPAVLALQGPTNRNLVFVEFSDDLVNWTPLYLEEDEFGDLMHPLWALDDQGRCTVTDTDAATIQRRCYRAILVI